MPKCPLCEGGQSKFTEVFLFEKDKSDEVSYVDCFLCGATGEVNEDIVASWKDHQKMWCECDPPSEQSYYVREGEHSDISKHHWRCKDCDKVTQIG